MVTGRPDYIIGLFLDFLQLLIDFLGDDQAFVEYSFIDGQHPLFINEKILIVRMQLEPREARFF